MARKLILKRERLLSLTTDALSAVRGARRPTEPVCNDEGVCTKEWSACTTRNINTKMVATAPTCECHLSQEICF